MDSLNSSTIVNFSPSAVQVNIHLVKACLCHLLFQTLGGLRRGPYMQRMSRSLGDTVV